MALCLLQSKDFMPSAVGGDGWQLGTRVLHFSDVRDVTAVVIQQCNDVDMTLCAAKGGSYPGAFPIQCCVVYGCSRAMFVIGIDTSDTS